MSRQYNIKWREQDEKELRRVARNFNAKLNRLVKTHPENANILPKFWNDKTGEFEQKITMDNLHSMIETRKDYNRIIRMLKRFSERGAEEIVEIPGNEYNTKTTKWMMNEMNRMRGIVNVKRQVRLDDLTNLEMMNASGLLGYTLGQRFGMGLASKNQLSPTKSFTRGQSQKDVYAKWRSLLGESKSKYHEDRDEFLKENYIKELQKNYDVDDIKEVIDAIKKMDAGMFYLKFEARGDRFESAYPPDRGSEEYWGYVEELQNYWMDEFTPLDIRPYLTTLLNQ